MTPDQLRDALRHLARNLRWTWDHRSAALLGDLPGAGGGRHPIVAVDELDEGQLGALVADEVWIGGVAEALATLEAEASTAVTEPDVVYFSPEFGLSETVPLYSGGLGVLAGDHLKAASDIGLSLAAVGLFYRKGFFRQSVVDGQQVEHHEVVTPDGLGCIDTGVTVEVPLAGRAVVARVWRVDVGRVPLLLLDTDLEVNTSEDRAITDQLYGGDRRHRLEQELVLGVGGARAVAAVGWAPGVHHLNEGHAGFLLLELLDRKLTGGAPTIAAALDDVRAGVLFTTHTPVPAGIDRFDRSLVEPYLRAWSERWEVPVSSVLELGLDPEAGHDVFNMAALCLRSADRSNGVSRLHGEVSRELFAAVPGGSGIASVTNGVHARTWTHPAVQDVFDETLGPRWADGDTEAWSWVTELDDDRIRALRRAMRPALADLLAARAGASLDPDTLVVGFARRFATYKRATLLLRHPEVLADLLADADRPIHLVFAGKAHPADGPGKALLADVVAYGRTAAANGRFTFLPDYDMGVARAMYAGCDVWLNTPVRPHEASGTSGEKAALNGVLNCSIADGWWAEMSDGRNGWDIASSSATDEAARDTEESAAALARLGELAAEYHGDGIGGASAAWIDRMRHAWATLGPEVTAARMVRDYERLLYAPMLSSSV